MLKFPLTLMPILLMAFMLMPLSFSQSNGKESMRSSKIKMHEQMADMHRQAADCLKAGKKTVEQCHQEAMKNCPMMKSGMCPMMMDHGDMKNHKNMDKVQDGEDNE